MLFVMDVGNTNIVAGIFDGEQLLHHRRIETDHNQTSDELGTIIGDFLQRAGLNFDRFEAVVVSTVVPPMMDALKKMCLNYFKQEPFIIGVNIETDLNIHIEKTSELGADRIMNAVAAIHEYPTPLIIIDFGTATTYCFIDESGIYQGGAIAPGIAISTEALYTKAAQLPPIDLAMPDSGVLGKNTITSMQSGILFGQIGQVEGMVTRLKALSTKPTTVIATGGLAKLISSATTAIDKVDPNLTLKGLQWTYQTNKENGEKQK